MARIHRKPCIVVDSNVWLSGLLFGGHPGKILELFIRGEISVVISEEIVSELRRTITHKFPKYVPSLALLEASIRKDVDFVRLGAINIRVCRDPEDNKVIETALAGKCDYTIMGDKDLLSLGVYQEVRIITPAEFIALCPTQ